MIRVGLTGGIGSGKTVVAKIFADIGIPVYFADEKAKFLMNTDKIIKAKIIEKFGEKTYYYNRLDNKYLANIVFNFPKKLTELEKIVHPAVLKDFTEWSNKQKSPYVIVENAILAKTGMDKIVDYIIYVDADEKLRIKRVMERSKLNKKDVKLRINQQNSEKKLKNKADFLIINNESIFNLTQEVKKIDFKLKKKLMKS